jgi:hypothetical protein
MNKALLLIILIFLIFKVSALQITEIESNPAGSDAGNEWVEFYNPDEINLSEYRLINGDGDEINLSGNFSGYYAYGLSKQWLDNSDEKVLIYKGNELIDETDLISDSENNAKTWQLCDGEWVFLNNSKNAENECPKKEVANEQNQTQGTNNQKEEISSSNNDENKNNTENKIQEVKATQKDNKNQAKNLELEAIVLSAQSIKSEDNKSGLDKNNIMSFGLVTFFLLLLFLLLIKNKKQKDGIQ